MTASNGRRETLARRIQRLEDIEAIRALKARYLNACDQKDPVRVRSCFADGDVPIDAEYRGVFDTADDFVSYYSGAALYDFVLDKHQAGNAEIEFDDATHARGRWCLDYRNINTRDRTVTLMSTFYHDRYEKIQGAWKITGSRTEFKTVLVSSYAGGALTPLVAGRTEADPPLAARQRRVIRARDVPALRAAVAKKILT